MTLDWEFVRFNDATSSSPVQCRVCGVLGMRGSAVIEPDSLETLILRSLPILQRCGVVRAIFFGPLARGEPSRKSDLDLILLQDTDKSFLGRYDGIFREISDAVVGRGVDLLIYTPSEFERMSGHHFMRKALKEGIVIHESGR